MRSDIVLFVALSVIATIMITGQIYEYISDQRTAAEVFASVLDYYNFDENANGKVTTTSPVLGNDIITWDPDAYIDCDGGLHNCAVDLYLTQGTANVNIDTNAISVLFWLNKYGTRYNVDIFNNGLHIFVTYYERIYAVAASGEYVYYDTISLGTYNFIAVTCKNNDTLTLYVNGDKVAETSVTTCYDTNTVTLGAGSVQYGLLDELIIANKKLTDNHVAAIYRNTMVRPFAAQRVLPLRTLTSWNKLLDLLISLTWIFAIMALAAAITSTRLQLQVRWYFFALALVFLAYVLTLSIASGVNIIGFIHVAELGQTGCQVITLLLALAIVSYGIAMMELI